MPPRPTLALRFAATPFSIPSRALTQSSPALRHHSHNITKTKHSQSYARPFSFTSFHYSTPMAAPTDTEAAQTANESGITPDSLKSTLESKLNASYVAIEDMSGGCGQAFNALIVSSEFDKKSHLQRHRLVNNALKTEIAAIHAWTPKCLTPEQWEKEQGSLKMT